MTNKTDHRKGPFPHVLCMCMMLRDQSYSLRPQSHSKLKKVLRSTMSMA